VFEYPVLAQLAAQLEDSKVGSSGAEVNEQIVRLNKAVGTQEPVFCLHDGFGKVWDYSRLALSLDDQRTVYGLPFNRSQLSEQALDLPVLAQQHLENIRAVQPQGPYTLCGWSFGAVVAHLVAAQLQAQGQEVRLVLVDPYVPPQPGENQDVSLAVQMQTFFSLLLDPVSLTALAQDADIQRQMQALTANSEPVAAIEKLMQNVLQHPATDFIQGYQYGSTQELFQLFASFQALFFAATGLQQLPVISVPARVYWRENRPESHHIWWHEWLGSEGVAHDILASDHFQIVRAPQVLAEFVTG